MKSARVKWVYLLSFILLPAAVLLLLVHKPAYYRRLQAVPSGGRQRHVDTYLTNELLASIYNNLQLGEPFDAAVTQRMVNSVMALGEWPMEFEDIKFFQPEVFFSPGRAVLAGAMNWKKVELIYTVVAAAEFDGKGLLTLKMKRVRIGALDVTLLAKAIAAGLCRKHLTLADGKCDDLSAKAVKSLLCGLSFDPVFSIDGKKVRAEKIDFTQKKAVIRIVPAGG